MANLTCTNCGAANQPGARFCVHCDAYLDWTGHQSVVPDPRPRREEPAPTGGGLGTAQRGTGFRPTFDQTSSPTYGPTDTAVPSLVCSWCRAANDPTRRFCRHCGNWLVLPTFLPSVERPGRRSTRPWWLGGERTHYSEKLSAVTVAYRVLAVLVAGALVVGLLAVTGQRPVRRVTDLYQHLKGTGRVDGITASSSIAQGGSAAAAVDGVRAVMWSPLSPVTGTDVDPDDACSPSGSSEPSILLTFPRPVDVREVGIEAGLPKGDPQLLQRSRPKVLRLEWTEGRCQAIRLEDEPELQRFRVNEEIEVSGVRITVLSSYPVDPAVPSPIDIGEITVWER